MSAHKNYVELDLDLHTGKFKGHKESTND